MPMLLQLSLGPKVDESDDPEDVRTQLTLSMSRLTQLTRLEWDVDITRTDENRHIINILTELPRTCPSLREICLPRIASPHIRVWNSRISNVYENDAFGFEGEFMA
jgi:hypothetical protein